MKVVRYLFGMLLAALGGVFAFFGAMIALGAPHLGPGLKQTAIGTPLAAMGAFVWGISFRFVPVGWPKLFFSLFLLPLLLYLILLDLAVISLVLSPEDHEEFWSFAFLIPSMTAWYWQIRNVLRSADAI